MPIPRRDLDELYAKYDFHPDILDIYVEGDFDFDFLNLFLEYIDATEASVISINDIEVGSETVKMFGLGSGSNKNRVLALAGKLDERYKNRKTNIFCLSDVDLDLILKKQKQFHHVQYTDYVCVEMYMLNKETLKRFLKFVCHLDEVAQAEFFTIAEKILPIQFALRAVSDNLKLHKEILDFSSGLKNKKAILSFDREKYILGYISFHALQSKKAQIFSDFDRFLGELSEDLRHSAHGHDFIHLLFEFVWSKGGLKLQGKEESEMRFGGRLVAMAHSHKTLVSEPLFVKIKSAVEGLAYIQP